MCARFEPEEFIGLSKHFLYGDSDIEMETLYNLDPIELKKNSLFHELPEGLHLMFFRMIFNRIYYGAFHYAYRKVSIKISLRGDVHRIHEKVILLLKKINDSAARDLSELRKHRVYADYNESKYRIPLTWEECHNDMKMALYLISDLGFSVLPLRTSLIEVPQRSSFRLSPLTKFKRCQENDFSCKKEPSNLY